MKAKVKVELNSVELKALESTRRMRKRLGYDKQDEYWQVAVVLSTSNVKTGRVRGLAECHVEPGTDAEEELALDQMELEQLRKRVAFLEEELPKRMEKLGLKPLKPVEPPGGGQAAGTTH